MLKGMFLSFYEMYDRRSLDRLVLRVTAVKKVQFMTEKGRAVDNFHTTIAAIRKALTGTLTTILYGYAAAKFTQ